MNTPKKINLKNKFSKFKHWLKKEKFLWGLEITSLGARLGFAKKFNSWDEFDEYMGWE